MDKYDVLRQYFGYQSFRPGQEDIIDAVISGRDALGVMPTGAGKSVCYQIPAMLFDGITIVISPLISLMQDQVTALVQAGIRAAYINSSLTMAQLYAVIRNASQGVYKLIYVAPERLDSEIFLNFAVNANISMITVDEAHCISQWGQDFRPSYLNIPRFAAALPQRPIITAFTATATDRVREDISKLLELKSPFTAVTGFDRKNLYFEVKHPSDKFHALLRLVEDYTARDRSGIVYCSTRKNVEGVCRKLRDLGYLASRYHAGLPEEEKRTNQEDFIYDRVKIMVATNAFGMGIDKSNVSYVIHYNMPSDVESYYQEAGRAGRDGSPADCILFYSGQDVMTAKFLINKSYEESELDSEYAARIRSRDLKKLSIMTNYCTCAECLRAYILRYFGENAPDSCNNCSECCSTEGMVDITVEAQKIMSCIVRAGQRYGARTICDVLRGSKNAKLTERGLDKLTTYGIMSDESDRRIMSIIDKLTALEYIEKTEDEYPVLKLRSSSVAVLKGQKQISARLPGETVRKKEVLTAADPVLYEKLRTLRGKLASTLSVPAYTVFTDSSLRDMCVRLPRTDSEFLQVSGVGSAKLDRFGKQFMQAISEHMAQNPNMTAPVYESPKEIRERKKKVDTGAALDSIISSADKLSFTETMTITAFCDMILTATQTQAANKRIRDAVTGWLVSNDYLCVKKDSQGHEYKDITEKSSDIGINSEKITASSTGQSYIRVNYTQKAQQFIIENLNSIRDYIS